MKIVLTSKQIAVLSNYFNDIAKGLMLAGLLSQGFTEVSSNLFRLIGSLFAMSFSLLLLYFSLLLNRK